MDNKAEVKHEFCNKCKCWRLPFEFLNAKGRKLKTCIKCRDRQKRSRDKNKCEHKRQKSKCKDCGGGSICEHKRQRSQCKECDFQGYLGSIVRSRMYNALKKDKKLSSKEYLGCNMDDFKIHIEKQI